MTGKEYERALQEEGVSGKKISQKAANKQRYSAREKKPVTIDDLGYVEKEAGKKGTSKGLASSEGYKKCDRLLALLKKHPSADQFMNLSVPGREVLDLATLERKLKTGGYTNSGQFAADVRKIWSNSWQLHQPGTDSYIATTEMSNYFEKLVQDLDIGDVPFIAEESPESAAPTKATPKSATATSRQPAATKPAAATSKNPAERPMSTQEKAQLKQNIMRLPQEKLQGVIKIIQSAVNTSKSRETLEFDIDKLPIRVCRELDVYVKKNITPAKKPAAAPGSGAGAASSKKKAASAAAAKGKKAAPAPEVYCFVLGTTNCRKIIMGWE